MRTSIGMIGLSEADTHLVSETSSRLIDKFPDGLARTITLRNWDWEIYDRLQRDKGWHDDDLPKMAYEMTILEVFEGPAAFERYIRLVFAYFISLNAGPCMEMSEANGNDIQLDA